MTWDYNLGYIYSIYFKDGFKIPLYQKYLDVFAYKLVLEKIRGKFFKIDNISVSEIENYLTDELTKISTKNVDSNDIPELLSVIDETIMSTISDVKEDLENIKMSKVWKWKFLYKYFLNVGYLCLINYDKDYKCRDFLNACNENVLRDLIDISSFVVRKFPVEINNEYDYICSILGPKNEIVIVKITDKERRKKIKIINEIIEKNIKFKIFYNLTEEIKINIVNNFLFVKKLANLSYPEEYERYFMKPFIPIVIDLLERDLALPYQETFVMNEKNRDKKKKNGHNR